MILLFQYNVREVYNVVTCSVSSCKKEIFQEGIIDSSIQKRKEGIFGSSIQIAWSMG